MRSRVVLRGLLCAGLALATVWPLASRADPPSGRRHRRKHHRKVKKKKKNSAPSHAPAATASPVPAAPSGAPPSPLAGPTEKLLIPVAGVRAEDLVDTYDGARSGGRVHDAIDILAPRNTPVLAAIAGTVIKLFHSERGGITINQLGDDGATVYYYAHLDHYAVGLAEGQRVNRGDIIGFVGDTGNAKPGNCHLHFAIWRVKDVKRYWEGTNVNPYPLLRP